MHPKIVKLEFPSWFLDNGNVLVETKNSFMTSGVFDNVPIIFYCQNGVVKEIVELYPTSVYGNLSRIKEKLKQYETI